MNTEPLVRPRRRLAAAAAAALAALAITVTATACGASAAGLPGTGPVTVPAGGATRSVHPAAARTAAGSGGATGAAHPATHPVTHPATHPASAQPRCSIGVVAAIQSEPSSVDAQRTASWVILQANGWTVPAPSSDWHLSASDGGADTFAPDGLSDASVAAWPAQTPWTQAALAQKVLSALAITNVHLICRTPVASSASGSTQGTEFTGDRDGMPVHVVMSVSQLAPTTSGLFYGETHVIYTPVSQWSTAAEQTLWLITKRAILVPQQP
jgi:hypothetical protein